MELQTVKPELSKEEVQNYLTALSDFGNSIRLIMPHDKTIETLNKMSELVRENPSMFQDISNFDNWSGIQQMAQKIGNDLTKGGKKVSLMDIVKIFPKIKKEVNSL